jgi:two-component sensor histidine kinase
MQMQTSECHRQLRSLFAFLRILVRDSTAGRESVEDYNAHLEGRISALSRVHEMLMRAPEEGVDLAEMVCAEVLAEAVPEDQYRVDGPDIRIAREAAPSVALALHELATNAGSHGAFATRSGRADVRWTVVQEQNAPWLRLEWIEHGVALNGAPERQGFGRELIERMLPYELNARTSFRFAEDGVHVELLVPAAVETANWQPGPNQLP